MTRPEGPRSTHKTRKEIRLLIGARIRALGQNRLGADLQPKTLREMEVEILEDVLDRANGYFDQVSLLHIIDLCILEDEVHARLYQDRSLKSFYGFRVRSLRVLKAFMLKCFNPKRWLKRHRK